MGCNGRVSSTRIPAALLPLLALAALAWPVGQRLADLRLDASTHVLLAGDDRSSASYEQLEAYLAGRHLVAVIVGHDAIFSNRGMNVVREVSRFMSRVPGAVNIKSLTHFERPVRHGLSFDVSEMIAFEALVPPGRRTDAEWQELADWVLDYPLARDLLVSSDGRYAMVLLVLERPLVNHAAKVALRAELEAALDPVRDREGLTELQLFAFPFIEEELQAAVTDDVGRLGLALLGLVVLILLVTYRSFTVLFWVLALQLVGLLGLPELLRWHGDSLNLFTSMLVPLIAGLQLGFVAHLCSAWQRERRAGRVGLDALGTAARVVLGPSSVAALTSAIGLAALMTCDVATVRDFGLYGAQAVGLAFALVFGLPLVLLGVSRLRGDAGAFARPAEPEPTRGERLVARVVALVIRRRRLVLAGTAGLVLACLPGVLDVRADMRAAEFLGERTRTRRALDILDEHLGGVNALQLEIDTGEPGAIARPENLAFMERVRTYALELPGVTGVYTYSLLFCLMHELWMEGAPGSFSIPDNPVLVGLFATASFNQHFPLETVLQDAERRRSHIVLRTRDMPASRYLEVVRAVERFAAAEAPIDVSVRLEDGAHSLLAADRRIVRGQRASVSVGIAAVFVALLLLWRSLRLAVLVVLCNLPALAVILALFGYADLPLNSITVMVAAVVLGIAVDDSIHLVSHYRRVVLSGVERHEALVQTLVAKLQPMTATTAMIVSGLGLLALSRFPPVVHFGVAAALALVVAWAGSVLLLPALVASFGPERGRGR